MAYDPQRDQRRQRPSEDESPIVDALLDGEVDEPEPDRHEPEAAASSGLAAPASDAWSERVLYSLGISTVLGAAAGLAALLLLWRICRRRKRR